MTARTAAEVLAGLRQEWRQAHRSGDDRALLREIEATAKAIHVMAAVGLVHLDHADAPPPGPAGEGENNNICRRS